MTDHKPLSDEELIGLDGPNFYLDPARRVRVVAQAREANRLRKLFENCPLRDSEPPTRFPPEVVERASDLRGRLAALFAKESTDA